MSGTGDFGAAGGTGIGSVTRSAPQVYHDAVLASQQSDGLSGAARSGPLPPLVAPPIDPSLGSFAPGGGPVRQGTEIPFAGGSVPVQQEAQPQQVPPIPDATDPPHDPRVAAQSQGFAMARVFDGVKPDGAPLINRQNLDPGEIQALTAS